MVQSSASCSVPTNADKIWTYEQYYTGDRDPEERKNGQGWNHWTGAESLEWYTGRFLRDTLHGLGEYRSRYRGDEGVFLSYEGHFYANRMHGFGTMSYPGGATFTGLFHNDIRWGPGIKSQACLREDVGLWRGTQLVRLAWRPSTPNVALELYVGQNGKACIDPHRILLTSRFKTIGEVNSAIEILKQAGAEPISASEKWTKLYPKNCNDLASQLCHVDVFEQGYYMGNIPLLEEVSSIPEPKENCNDLASQLCHVDVFEQGYYKGNIPLLEEVSSIPEPKENESQHSEDSCHTKGTFYAWNNNEMITHMMKHSFTHEKQRSTVIGINLKSLLAGPRNQFKRAGKHELNCRTLLMASYLGHIANVAQLLNELNVHPDIADSQGNTALMYAACGDQVDTIHFLVEAGANVHSYSDTCCTPLGVAMMRYACARKDISANGMVQALIPPPVIPAPQVSTEPKPTEWHMVRETTVQSLPGPGVITRTPSRTGAKIMPSQKKLKPAPSDEATQRKKTEFAAVPKADLTNDDAGTFAEENKLYNDINTEFSIKITDLFSQISGVSPVPYLFEINDMVKEIDASEDDQKKPPEKVPKKAVSKMIRDTIKPSKEIMWQSSTDRDEFGSIDSAEKVKIELVSKMMMTILQLLSDGADPNLVRCPQPALLIATASGCPDLVRHMINYGADVNEVYPQSLNYTALDVAVSRPLTYENLDLVRTLLECGAKTDHRLRYSEPDTDPEVPDIPGPTLLHAVLARKTENETQEELRQQLLELLLDYNCNPMILFKGSSATNVAMNKNMDIFDIFMKSPRTKLNVAINDANQTVLVKIFSTPFCKTIPSAERLQTVTNLLLFGADPLLECRNGEEVYKNIFIFARKTLTEIESAQSKPVSPASGKSDTKAKKADKSKKDEKLSVKSQGKLGTDDIGDYKQALDLMTECARMLHVRWLQAKLLKELIEIVSKYKHRQWNMIVPEHKNKKACGLWLSSERSLEIWDILKVTKRKVFEDKRVLKHVLCIVQFYSRRSKSGFRPRLTAEEKDMVDSRVKYLLRDHKVSKPYSEEMPWSRPYVMPELAKKAEVKFKVCFECALPLNEDKITCSCCKLVSFCSFDCMRENIARFGCHPCSEFLKNKYFPSPDESVSQDIVTV